MSKSKKTPIFKYGIEITMRSNIRHAWSNEVIKFNANDEWPTEGKIVDIQKSVQAIGYGDGYTIDDVQKDFLQELDNTADWQLHENYSYCTDKDLSTVIENTYTMPEPDWAPNC